MDRPGCVRIHIGTARSIVHSCGRATNSRWLPQHIAGRTPCFLGMPAEARHFVQAAPESAFSWYCSARARPPAWGGW